MDFVRIAEITKVIEKNELDSEAYFLQQDFLAVSGANQCAQIEQRLTSLKEEVRKVGIDLSNYGSKGFFKKKDYDYLKRKYFLLELQFLTLVNGVNDRCGSTYIPIIFFYKIDDALSERQGYVLDDINEAYPAQVVVVSLDKDYVDEPIVSYLVKKYNVTKAPTVIIDNNIKQERLLYTGELNATILRLLRRTDEYSKGTNFDFVIDATKTNKSLLMLRYKQLVEINISPFAKGDILLALGRLSNNESLKCLALRYYDEYKPQQPEERALLFETYASIGCGRNRKAFLLEASRIWKALGNNARSEIEERLSQREEPLLVFEPSRLNATRIPRFSKVTIGRTGFSITKSDVLVSQVDRVNRDWLSGQLNSSPFSQNLLTVFSERYTLPEFELLPDIGWHEGARIKEIQKIGLKRYTATGTLVAKRNGTWFAPDEKGIFRFEVPLDKVLYPTTRFLSEDLAVIVDTHGVNMLVEQALRLNASVVIGCCDNPSKVAAAKYLAGKGIKVVCFTDKYLPLILGSNLSILGSPPMLRNGNSVLLGSQPVSILSSDVLLVEDVANYSQVQSYYDTPARYFSQLNASLDVHYFGLSASSGPEDFIDAAVKLNANVVAARVYSLEDYLAISSWLREDMHHRAILFHSAPYPFGLIIYEEFRDQTSFDDIHPEFS
ncbi:MAG: hypothetical protein V1837_07335 [Candidatus Woesearchaeota archaeon]